MGTIYLDHAATTPLDPRVRAAMEPLLGAECGNPSSRHGWGTRAARAIEAARAQVASALLVEPRGVLFTSGGTEAVALGLLGLARAARSRGRHVLVGATEHACVRENAASLAREGFEVEQLRLDARGDLDVEHASSRLRGDTVLVTHMVVNNEFGTRYDVTKLARAARARAPHAVVLVDAVQAVGKLDCAAAQLGWDALALSAHKLGGPQGVGALVLAKELALEPLYGGGGQERGLRSGTQNVAGIVGLGRALQLAESERVQRRERLEALRARLREGLAARAGVRVLTPGSANAPHVLAAIFDGAPAEVRMHHLERHGVLVGTASACQAAKKELSPGLAALSLSTEEIRRVLRFSLSHTNTLEEIDATLDALDAVQMELERVA